MMGFEHNFREKFNPDFQFVGTADSYTAQFYANIMNMDGKFAVRNTYRQAIKQEHTALHNFCRPCTKYLFKAITQYKV